MSAGEAAVAFDRLVEALERAGCRVDGSGRQRKAQCPAHDDRNPSLSVTDEGSRVLIRCHAGCDTDAVLEALGMSAADLFNDQGERQPSFTVVAEYRYTDEFGELLFVKERRQPKGFRVRRPDGKGGWAWGLGGSRRVLYRLAELPEAIASGRTVYVVEGEKDADRLAALGQVATCNHDGAAKAGQRPKWRPEYGDALRGADVVIIADRDEPGVAHARAIAADLSAKAKSVVIVQAAVTAPGADVSDHLDAGHALAELVPLGDAAAAEMAGAEHDDEASLPAAPDFPHGLAQGPLRDLMDWAQADGLPVSYVAAVAEAAAAFGAAGRCGAVGSGEDLGARLQLTATRRVLPVLWVALIGGSGSGKNPSLNVALKPLAIYYAMLMAQWLDSCALADKSGDDPLPRPQALVQSSINVEAMARWIAMTGGAGLVRNGELASFLKGLGQYKAGGGSDRYDVMDMWSSEPISIERVGVGGPRNAVQIYVPCPRMSIVGGLVPENAKFLGAESDGLRARFLPILPSSQVIPNLDGSKPIPESWTNSLTRLLDNGEPREWLLRGDARELVREAISAWKDRERDGADPVVVKTALAKADEQCLRIALAVAESEAPGKGGDIPVWAVQYAIARVEYSLGCWMALGSDQVMAFSRKDEVLNAGVADLLRAIEARTPGPDGRRYMTRREIQRAQVAGATRPALVDNLIRAYHSAYPGCVTVYDDAGQNKFPFARRLPRSAVTQASRGPAPVIVYAPQRRPQATLPGPHVPSRKLSDPTVSGRHTSGQADTEAAGHGPTGPAEDARKLSGEQPPDSFSPTVSQVSAEARADSPRPGSGTGPCIRCGTPCRRYGSAGNPLCDPCRAGDATAAPAPAVPPRTPLPGSHTAPASMPRHRRGDPT